MIRVELPPHLRTLVGVTDEVTLQVTGAATQRSVLDALEARYPVLRGTMRDHVTQQRRNVENRGSSKGTRSCVHWLLWWCAGPLLLIIGEHRPLASIALWRNSLRAAAPQAIIGA